MKQRKKFKRVVPDDIKIEDLSVEDITCGTTKCNEDFHCYSLKKSSLRNFGQERVCYECGVDLIDWERVHQNNIDDIDFLIPALKNEIIRHVFWHTPIETDALLKVLNHGKIKTKERVYRTLKSRIGKLTAWDGRQTPMGKDEIINYAQHATATCCRKCLEVWHNIQMDKVLTEDQLNFCASLVLKYVEIRVPQITNNGLQYNEALKIVEDEHH